MKHLPNNADQPAYPFDAGDVVFTGLSKREEFAKAAMQGLLANYREYGMYGNSESSPMVAYQAVQCADETLAELERTKR